MVDIKCIDEVEQKLGDKKNDEMDISQFLKLIGDELAIKSSIITRNKKILNGTSVVYLTELMKKLGIDKLYYKKTDWELTKEGRFKNKFSYYETEGNIYVLNEPYGIVFTRQNKHLNPFFGNKKLDDEKENIKKYRKKQKKAFLQLKNI